MVAEEVRITAKKQRALYRNKKKDELRAFQKLAKTPTITCKTTNFSHKEKSPRVLWLRMSHLRNWLPWFQFSVLSHPGTQRQLQTQTRGAWPLFPLTSEFRVIYVMLALLMGHNSCVVKGISTQILTWVRQRALDKWKFGNKAEGSVVSWKNWRCHECEVSTKESYIGSKSQPKRYHVGCGQQGYMNRVF